MGMQNPAVHKALALFNDRQTDLAKAVGCTQPCVHKWLFGKSRPSAEAAIAIERATEGAVTRADVRPDLFGPVTGAGVEEVA